MFMEFVSQNIWLFVALVVIVVMLAYSYFGEKLTGYQSVSPEEATRLYNDGAKLVDVRSDAEYKTGRIGEAENLPVSSFENHLNRLEAYKDQPIVVYCQSGARSAKAAGILAKHGFQQVYNLAGGIMAWKAAGLPTNQPTKGRKERKAAGSKKK